MKKKDYKIIKNKNIILIILLIVIAGSIYYLNSQRARPGDFETVQEEVLDQTEEIDIEKQIDEIPKSAVSQYIKDDQAIKLKSLMYQQAPELRRIAGYINTDEKIKISDLKGKVVLIDFWTYTCINCIRTMPYLRSWYDKYKDDGLVIIGVHTPEFEFEKDFDNVKNQQLQLIK